jgi:hypothetical protein
MISFDIKADSPGIDFLGVISYSRLSVDSIAVKIRIILSQAHGMGEITSLLPYRISMKKNRNGQRLLYILYIIIGRPIEPDI